MPASIPMTARERAELLALPDTEEAVVRYHSLDVTDLAAIARARTPETRLSYALQLCALRFPGRHLQRDEVLPPVMLGHIVEQIGVDADVVVGFARRRTTRYDQLTGIKSQHGFRDLTALTRASINDWLEKEAIGLTDGRVLLERLIARMRRDSIVIPGFSVVERMAAEAMLAADRTVNSAIERLLNDHQRQTLDGLLSDKMHPRQSQLAWLREPPGRVGSRGLGKILDKLDLVRSTGADQLSIPDRYRPRLVQMEREGLRLIAQNFEQMNPARRYTVLVATIRELGISLTDAALTMFGQLVGRANLNARKRLEMMIAVSADQGRERLMRVADVLDAFTKAATTNRNVVPAILAVAPLEQIQEDAALIRRTVRPGRPDVLSELAPEYRTFKRMGPRFLASFTFQSRPGTASLHQAMHILVELGGDRRKSLPANVPMSHVERRWQRHVGTGSGIDRTYWELATYFAVADGLASGDLWVSTSRLHRSLDDLLTPSATLEPTPARLPIVSILSAEEWLEKVEAELDTALLNTASSLKGKESALFVGEKLRFPKEKKDNLVEIGEAERLTATAYSLLPTTRITDVLSHVARWTNFTEHFRHVSTGLPPQDERVFLAALIAEATNLGLTRMADVCDAASRRAMLRMQTWHMREETFRAGLANLTDAIHAEPLSAWFGEGWRASADGQAFNLGGPGNVTGEVNAHYGRDPIVKIYTTITACYAPLHQTVIAGTAGEAIHALDGILGHQSGINVETLHVDGGGVSDIIFAVMHLLGLNFEPRIPRLSDRRLYAFESKARYGLLAPLFGKRLDRQIIRTEWNEALRLIEALRNRIVTPSLILKKLSRFRQQNGLAAALREIGRVQRTLFTLRWFRDPPMRTLVTSELNKGEARNSLARAVAFHRLGRFRDRGHEQQQIRAAALTLVTAAIALFNCRYLSKALDTLRADGMACDERLLPHFSPLGWDHINLTGDYVWSDILALNTDGFLPLKNP